MPAPDQLDFNLESGYDAPGFNAVAFFLPYPPPPANAVDFDLESGYTAPPFNAVDFGVTAGPVDPDEPQEHIGSVYFATEDATGSVSATATPPTSVGTASAATDAAAASVEAVHGITGTISATTDDTDAQAGGQQAAVAAINATTDISTGAAEARTFTAITASSNTATDAASAAATAQHIEPRIATIAATTDAASAEATAIFEVYCLTGAVQDRNGFPMERTVRAHRLEDGALAAETVSNSAGIFDINVGFESGEFYVIALDTTPEGTDYLPPITNRVTSVLRYD